MALKTNKDKVKMIRDASESEAKESAKNVTQFKSCIAELELTLADERNFYAGKLLHYKTGGVATPESLELKAS